MLESAPAFTSFVGQRDRILCKAHLLSGFALPDNTSQNITLRFLHMRSFKLTLELKILPGLHTHHLIPMPIGVFFSTTANHECWFPLKSIFRINRIGGFNVLSLRFELPHGGHFLTHSWNTEKRAANKHKQH